MVTAKIEEAAYQLRRTLAAEADELGEGHRWVSEADRWKELVFALLTETTAASEPEVRLVAERTSELGLLDVTDLAAIAPQAADSDLARHLVEEMMHGGFTKDEAVLGLRVLVETAAGLEEHYGGKVQRYLRHFAKLMLADTHRFAIEAIDRIKVADAFTYWLQNVAEMPLSLVDDTLRAYASGIGVTPEELVDAADEIDLNVAVMDDLAALHMADHA